MYVYERAWLLEKSSTSIIAMLYGDSNKGGEKAVWYFGESYGFDIRQRGF